jgi:hypothetical protein
MNIALNERILAIRGENALFQLKKASFSKKNEIPRQKMSLPWYHKGIKLRIIALLHKYVSVFH